jgi:hypothetical protein
MWTWRRMEKISWIEKKSHEEIHRLVREERCTLEAIAKSKKAWIGHVKLVIEERIEGKNLGAGQEWV